MRCAKIVRPVFIRHSPGVPGMAREYAQFQIDLRPVPWQTHVSTHFNDPSQLDSWTVLIVDLRLQIECADILRAQPKASKFENLQSAIYNLRIPIRPGAAYGFQPTTTSSASGSAG